MRWWWPTPGYYWPSDAPREETIAAFVHAFGLLGYKPSSDIAPPYKADLVALYADSAGAPTHMARLLPSGQWTSKLGSGVDIIHHDLSLIQGTIYGNVVLLLARHNHQHQRQPGA